MVSEYEKRKIESEKILGKVATARVEGDLPKAGRIAKEYVSNGFGHERQILDAVIDGAIEGENIQDLIYGLKVRRSRDGYNGRYWGYDPLGIIQTIENQKWNEKKFYEFVGWEKEKEKLIEEGKNYLAKERLEFKEEIKRKAREFQDYKNRLEIIANGGPSMEQSGFMKGGMKK
jgi:hypothetical protein